MNKNTIYDLYYGNITPSDINLTKIPELNNSNQELLGLINEIETALGEKNSAIFDNYNDIVNKQYTKLQLISFEEGFRLGLRLAVEALYNDNEKENKS